MSTRLVYMDEAGDDGIIKRSSDDFVLTSINMSTEIWHRNYDVMKAIRAKLNKDYGLHSSMEFHTKDFLYNKSPYWDFKWDGEKRRMILGDYLSMVSKYVEFESVNVVIDKSSVKKPDTYNILENALKYNIQRIENSSGCQWNYIVITDKGRIAPMRRTAREICAYNPIPSMLDSSFINKPITGLIEDIIEKDSAESYFIQICDSISYFVHLYFMSVIKGNPLPNRVSTVIDIDFIKTFMDMMKADGRLNLKSTSRNEYGIVIYPR